MGRARKDEMREANNSHVGHFMDGGRAGAGSGAGMGYGDSRSGFAAPGAERGRSTTSSSSSRRRIEVSPVRTKPTTHIQQHHAFGCSPSTYLMATEHMALPPEEDATFTEPRRGTATQKAIEKEIEKDASDRKGRKYNLIKKGIPITSIAHTYRRGHYPLDERTLDLAKLKKAEAQGHAGVLQTNILQRGEPKGQHVSYVRSTATPDRVMLHDPLSIEPKEYNVADLLTPKGYKSGAHQQTFHALSAIRPTGSRYDPRAIARAERIEKERVKAETADLRRNPSRKRPATVSPESTGSYIDSYASDDEGLMKRGGPIKRHPRR